MSSRNSRSAKYPGPRSRTYPPTPRPSRPLPAATHTPARVSDTRGAFEPRRRDGSASAFPVPLPPHHPRAEPPRSEPHDHPPRRLQLRTAHPHHRRRALARLHVPLPGVPAPHRRRDQQPGALCAASRSPSPAATRRGRARPKAATRSPSTSARLAAPPSTGRAKASPATSPSPSAPSPTRPSPRRRSPCGRSTATPGSPSPTDTPPKRAAKQG